MVTKTREKLIEVARQLFAHKGIENTTMNDIATASDKGRRTIYTYFKNKRDIYNAVVERESDHIMERLSAIVASEKPSVSKLREFLEARFDMFLNAFNRRDTFRALFGRDFRRLEKTHRLIFDRELKMLRAILADGVADGSFDPVQADRLPALEVMLYQGIDYSHFRNNFADTGMTPEVIRRDAVDFLMEAVVKH